MHVHQIITRVLVILRIVLRNELVSCCMLNKGGDGMQPPYACRSYKFLSSLNAL